MSWTTPAAAAACALAHAVLPAQVETDLHRQARIALEKARPALLRHLDGASGGHLALLCLAALHDEVDADDASLRRAIDRLARARLDGTYDLALRLQVMAEMPGFPAREALARRDAKALLGNQTGGGFSYRGSSGRWDLSNTQYAALGLSAAESLGAGVPRAAWVRLGRVVGAAQKGGGGFGYTPSHGDSYPSMTVAGIAVLELCRERLGAATTGAMRLEGRIARAWRWMARHDAAIGDVGERWTYYFHYGLERAAVLSGKDRVGDIDWYAAGARMLIAAQCEDGGWADRRAQIASEPVNTAFAILFLRRKFRRVDGPTTLSGITVLTLPAQADALQAMHAVELTVARGLAATPDVLRAMRSPLRVRREAAADALRQITGRDFGYRPALEPAETGEAIKAAERWWLTEGRRQAADAMRSTDKR